MGKGNLSNPFIFHGQFYLYTINESPLYCVAIKHKLIQIIGS